MVLFKVYVALAKNKIKVKYDKLSYLTYLRIDEIYLLIFARLIKYQDYKTRVMEIIQTQKISPKLFIFLRKVRQA